MGWQDVTFHFSNACLLKLRPQWLDVRLYNRFNGQKPSWIMEVSVRKTTTGFIFGIHQRDRRHLKADDPYKTYGAFLITCVAFDPRSGQWDAAAQSHGGTFWRGRDVNLEVSLAPNERPYYILPRRYTEDQQREVTVSVRLEHRECVTIALRQPSDEIMNAVRYSPVWKFDPAPCPLVVPLPPCQIDRVDATTLSW